jgi:anthranilate phosphoribosyltransferase
VNALILEDILKGNDQGAKRNMVLLNAAAGLCCAGLADCMNDALSMAKELIDSGAALDRLRRLQAVFR